jgi:NADPH2:quinone reductase
MPQSGAGISAAAQIGKWRGARVIGVDRYQLPSRSPAARAIDDFILLEDEPLDLATRRLTKGQGAQVVFDAVGGPLFEPALRSLAHRGRQLELTSAVDRRVSLDLLDFYHDESRLFGVDTRKRDATASAAILEALTPFFEDGAFQAPVIDRVIPLSEGSSAYAQVAGGEARGRLILVP